MKTPSLILTVAALLAAPLRAQDIPTETYTMEGVQVVVTLHDFLSPEGVAMLRLVGQNQDALALFVPDGARYAAMALAPEDGLVQDGLLSESAVAVADLPTLEEARAAALEGCNSARSGGAECVIALEIQPE